MIVDESANSLRVERKVHHLVFLSNFILGLGFQDVNLLYIVFAKVT